MALEWGPSREYKVGDRVRYSKAMISQAGSLALLMGISKSDAKARRRKARGVVTAKGYAADQGWWYYTVRWDQGIPVAGHTRDYRPTS